MPASTHQIHGSQFTPPLLNHPTVSSVPVSDLRPLLHAANCLRQSVVDRQRLQVPHKIESCTSLQVALHSCLKYWFCGLACCRSCWLIVTFAPVSGLIICDGSVRPPVSPAIIQSNSWPSSAATASALRSGGLPVYIVHWSTPDGVPRARHNARTGFEGGPRVPQWYQIPPRKKLGTLAFCR